MAHQSKHVIVGGAVITAIGIAFVIVVWMVRADHGHQKQYDIFFPTSTAGLSAGSIVTFLGVPVGKIRSIKLLPQAPHFIWVRISIDEHTPVLHGTTARIANVGITGVRTIDLSGGQKGASPIGDLGPLGVPVIPARRDPFSFAPDLLDKAAVDARRLSELLGGENRRSIHHILGNVDHLTTGVAQRDPQVHPTLPSAHAAFRHAADAIRALSTTRNDLLQMQERSAIVGLREAARSVRRSEQNLGHEIAESKSTVKMLTRQTAPEVSQLGRNLSDFTDALAKTGRSAGANGFDALAPGRDLPTYRPHRRQRRKGITGDAR